MSSKEEYLSILTGVIQADNTPTKARDLYGQWAKHYDQNLTTYSTYNACIYPAIYLEKFRPDQKDLRILDVAAGTGMGGLELVRRGYRTLDALDLTPSMLEEAEKKNIYQNIIIAEMGPRPTQILPGTYDALVAGGCFLPGHMNEECFPELIRITKPGGVIVIAMRELYLRDDPRLSAKFESTMSELQHAGYWRLLTREVQPNYFDEEDGAIFVLEKL